jgi:hypothetical protein
VAFQSWLVKLNGISVILVMGVVNAGLSLMLSFGVNLTTTQVGAITAFVNAMFVAVAAVAHSNAKHTKTVIPAPRIDESHLERHVRKTDTP